MANEFKRPTKDNVELGDFVVREAVRSIILSPVEETDKKAIHAIGTSVRYEDAVVLKKDGSYLVGENITVP